MMVETIDSTPKNVIELALVEDVAESPLRERTDSTRKMERFPAPPRSNRCRLPKLSAPDQFGSYADNTAPTGASLLPIVCSPANDGRSPMDFKRRSRHTSITIARSTHWRPSAIPLTRALSQITLIVRGIPRAYS